jgi:hypothetical protein
VAREVGSRRMPAFRLVLRSWWSRKRKVDVWWGKMMGSKKLRITNFKSRDSSELQSCRGEEMERGEQDSHQALDFGKRDNINKVSAHPNRGLIEPSRLRAVGRWRSSLTHALIGAKGNPRTVCDEVQVGGGSRETRNRRSTTTDNSTLSRAFVWVGRDT